MLVSLFLFLFSCQVDDSQKDTQLVQHLIHTEAPVFIVASSVLYRALVVAAGSQHITQWYPRIVAKVRAEVQEGLHGFIRWLNTNSVPVSLSTVLFVAHSSVAVYCRQLS